MTEVLYYQLERRALEDVLPSLLEKTIERGWRALVQADSAERADAIDTLLWTYDDQSFLPHAQAGEGDSRRQPVLITVEGNNANAAEVLFLLGTAQLPASQESRTAFVRIVVLFDGRDPEALEAAQRSRKQSTEEGHAVTFWKESGRGTWELQT